jgi:L-lactate dehydrogenase complex protein LldF
MSSSTGTSFKSRAAIELKNEVVVKAVKKAVDHLVAQKRESTDLLGDWELWRERARAIRAHTIEHLDYYLDRFSRNAECRGAQVHFAEDAAEGARIFVDIARRSGAKLVAKSKSMVSEEMHVNHHLEAIGVECVETDLAERIIQLAHETPSHIVIPGIHKNRHQIQELFEREGGQKLAPDTPTLTAYARRALRESFRRADIGMTGCNFAIADTGSVVTFSNEGNARMVTTLPRVHVVVMGMERILPSLDDLEVMTNVLPRAAAGQKTTVYVSVLSGPRRQDEVDGPEEAHIIVLDNGRSAQLGDPEFQAVLNCIRCGACLNVCPVYRQVGGHSYGSVYSGPIGAVLTPLLRQDDKQAGELAFASSLCGACAEACPVKIPLHDMLVHLRRRYVQAGHAGIVESAAMKGFAAVFGSTKGYEAAGNAARWVQLNVVGENPLQAGPMAGWTKYRAAPTPQGKSFRELWPDLERELNEGWEG